MIVAITCSGRKPTQYAQKKKDFIWWYMDIINEGVLPEGSTINATTMVASSSTFSD